jgi:hypothetical protein
MLNQDRSGRQVERRDAWRPTAGSESRGRCPAAHAADPRPCEGVIDAVQIVDHAGASVAGCLLHGIVLLASLDRGRVCPLNGADGSAITVFTRAQTLRPFDFLARSSGVPTTSQAAVLPVVRRAEDTDRADAGRGA